MSIFVSYDKGEAASGTFERTSKYGKNKFALAVAMLTLATFVVKNIISRHENLHYKII